MAGLPVASYDISEFRPAGWTLGSVNCVDDANAEIGTRTTVV